MRIGIQTWGSDGDINPFLALAGGLVAAGHDVTLALTSAERKDYGGPARRLGFRLADAGHIGRDEADLVEIARRVHDEASPLRQLDLILEEMFEPGVGRMLEVAERLCRDNDLVIGHFIVHPAQAVAERAGRPYVTVTLNHSAIPSRHLPLMGTPHLGPFLNGLLWRLGQRILSLHIVPPINRLRSRLGLRAVSSYREVWESRLANLIAVSPSLCRRPPDWEPHQRVCGFFAMPEAAQPFEMPHALEGFLAGGPPPIFCTFGSMTAVDDGTGIMEESTRLLVEGARLAGCRAIVQSRWDLVSSVPDDSGLYKIGAAPHSRIRPRCAAVVHHGGAGTTQTATLHGLPSVVVPHISDQYFWARELNRLGVAPRVADRRKITARELAEAIRSVLRNDAMRARARELGRAMAAEDGVGTAVGVIEQVMSGVSRR
jgi:UDP:flavonoid glycosyltransferase YjiC (YdhE family)